MRDLCKKVSESLKGRHTLVVNEDLQLAIGDNKEGCPRGPLLDHLILANVGPEGSGAYGYWKQKSPGKGQHHLPVGQDHIAQDPDKEAF